MTTAFEYRRPLGLDEALALGARPGAAFIAGGTDFLQLWKSGLAAPDAVVDVGALQLGSVALSGDDLVIGAMARLDDVAASPLVVREYPLIAQAIRASASRQLRTMATVGGNLLQRTRCPYFRGALPACNKRDPGSGCGALEGENRGSAIFGADADCVATHASDLAVALAALDARLEIASLDGRHVAPLADFYRRAGEPAEQDTHLHPGELILAVRVPVAGEFAMRSTYLKVRDRAAFEFAVVSVAACVELVDGRIVAARLSAGGVAPCPWRLTAAEDVLVGGAADEALFREAARVAVLAAEPLAGAAFKVELLGRSVLRALQTIGAAP